MTGSRLRPELLSVLLAGRDEMLELPPAPAWMADAACREHPDVSWFPTPGASGLDAKTICDRCLVKEECLGYALEHDLDGIWGGTTVRQRRRVGQAQAARWEARGSTERAHHPVASYVRHAAR